MNNISSTLGHCSLIRTDDWLTTRWVDQEKSKHCHICLSVPVCSLLQFTSARVRYPAATFQPICLAASFLLAAMRASAVTAVVVMMCGMVVHADVKPQKDFNLQRVRWTDIHTDSEGFLLFPLLLFIERERTLCSGVCVCVCVIRVK